MSDGKRLRSDLDQRNNTSIAAIDYNAISYHSFFVSQMVVYDLQNICYRCVVSWKEIASYFLLCVNERRGMFVYKVWKNIFTPVLRIFKMTHMYWSANSLASSCGSNLDKSSCFWYHLENRFSQKTSFFIIWLVLIWS